MPKRRPTFRPSWTSAKPPCCQQQTAIAQAVDRITQPGLALDKDSPGMTPAEGLANLQAQVQEVQNQLDELSDLARQHDIPPGVLRG